MSTLDKVKLSRISSRADGTFGTLAINNLPIAVTLELPWNDNKRSESCIPAGSYLAKRVLSPKFGDVFEVTGVPNRSHILIHKGNIKEDTQGCILVGENFVLYNSGKCAVGASGAAFAEFMQMLSAVNSFELEVVNHY